mgnify:FL=1
MEHTIKFYPVGNADCTLIKLSNGKTIIIDCQIKDNLMDNGKQIYFDVKRDLLNELKKDIEGRPFVDLFINTHPHKDHCDGFGTNFFHGAPSEYNKERDKNKIIIGELWVTPRGVGNVLTDCAEDIRREAKRRREIYDRDRSYNGGYGNYLRIVGYDKNKEFDSRYGYVPGKTVLSANGKPLEWLEIFIHAPFKEDITVCKEADDKNATSIVVQFGFKISSCTSFKCRVLMGGDAEHEIWQHILDNNIDDEHLKWDIFLAPHHCSWTFFNDSSDKEKVMPSADEIMKKQLGSRAYVVASSNAIMNDGKNPPCYQAQTEYKKRLGNKDNFLNTATDHLKGSISQPIVFKIAETGKRHETIPVAAGDTIISRPAPRAGK